MPQVIDYQSVKSAGLPICKRCEEILKNDGGSIEISGVDVVEDFRPRMWRHSERDVYHAWIYVAGRHIILCGTKEFDERTLKRIKPLNIDENLSWQIFINGKTYTILDHGNSSYEILNHDGTIVKDEEIEAMVFTYMMKVNAR